jgi:hypothetical protein
MGKREEEKKQQELEKINRKISRLYDMIDETVHSKENSRKLAKLYERSAELNEMRAELTPGLPEASGFYSVAADHYNIAKSYWTESKNQQRAEFAEEKHNSAFKKSNAVWNQQEQTSQENAAETQPTVPVVQQLSSEIHRLENQLEHVEKTKVKNDDEEIKRLKNKLALNSTLGSDYKQLGDLAEADDKRFYAKSAAHFANAANEAFMLGRDKESRDYYMNAARVSKKLGDAENVKYFTQRAKNLNRRAVKKGLDDKLKGVYIFILFGAVLFFMSPRLTGNVVGAKITGIDFLALLFFVLFIVVLGLKIYAKRI